MSYLEKADLPYLPPELQLSLAIRDAHRQTVIETLAQSNILMTGWDHARVGSLARLCEKDRSDRGLEEVDFSELSYDGTRSHGHEQPSPIYPVNVLGHRGISLLTSTSQIQSRATAMREPGEVCTKENKHKAAYTLAADIDFPVKTLAVYLHDQPKGTFQEVATTDWLETGAMIYTAPEMRPTAVAIKAYDEFEVNFPFDMHELSILNRMLPEYDNSGIDVLDAEACVRIVAAIRAAKKHLKQRS